MLFNQALFVECFERLGRNLHTHPAFLGGDPDTFGHQIGIEAPLGLVVRVRHVVPRAGMLACYRTSL